MPLYEYECIKNGHRFEVIQKFSDSPVKICSRCRSKVRKILSRSAISFKGSGWYVTDYARSGSNGKPRSGESSSEPAGSGAKADGAPKGSGSSDSKPAGTKD